MAQRASLVQESLRASPELLRATPLLTIVVPTFNESGNVIPLISRLRATLATDLWEVVFADDNSPDETYRLVKQIAATDPQVRCLRRVGRRGLAGACIEGILSSSAAYVAVMDGDLQHDEAILRRMLDTLEETDADIVIGSRYAEGGSASGLVGSRNGASRFANLLAQKLLDVRVSDPMSGFFMMRRERFEEIAPNLSPAGFKILLDILTSSHGALRIVEEPFTFGTREYGQSKLDVRVVLEFLGLLAAKMSGGIIDARFIPYAFVGTLGLLLHLTVLTAIEQIFRIDFEVAQILATFCALIANFFFNNMLTYKDKRIRGMAIIKGIAVYGAIGATGFIANVGVASWLYGANPVWWLAGAAGALIGAVWNYAMASRLVWHTR